MNINRYAAAFSSATTYTLWLTSLFSLPFHLWGQGLGATGNVLKTFVPFPFEASGKTMPAGDYTVELRDSRGLVSIRHDFSGEMIVALVGVRTSTSSQEASPALSFQKVEDRYKLLEIEK
jgi:hypothetical protein